MSLLTAIFAQAWDITRRRRALWLFGFLAALLGVPTMPTRLMPRWADLRKGFSPMPPGAAPLPQPAAGWQPQAFWKQVFTAMPPHTAAALSMIKMMVALVFIILFYALLATGTGALLWGAAQAARGETWRVGDLWAAARRFFWRIFFFPWPAMLLLFILTTSGGVFLAAAAWGGAAWAGLLAMLFYPLFMVIAWLVNIYIQLGNSAIAIENLSLWDAMSRAWEVWKAHFWKVLLVALMLWLVGEATWVVAGYLAALGYTVLGLLLQEGGRALVAWFVVHPALAIAADSLIFLSSKLLLALLVAPVKTFVLVGWTLLYLAMLKTGSLSGKPLSEAPATSENGAPL